MIAFTVYKMLDHHPIRWSSIVAPYHTKPQDLREEFMRRYPQDTFIIVRDSRVEKA